jgi:hypothetical protein
LTVNERTAGAEADQQLTVAGHEFRDRRPRRRHLDRVPSDGVGHVGAHPAPGVGHRAEQGVDIAREQMVLHPHDVRHVGQPPGQVGELAGIGRRSELHSQLPHQHLSLQVITDLIKAWYYARCS